LSGKDASVILIPNYSGTIDVNGVLDGFFLAEKKKKILALSESLYVNDQSVSLEKKLSEGDILMVLPGIFDNLDYPVWNHPYSVLYEDEWTYVLDKPAGIIIHPDSKDKNGTLANLAANYLSQRNLDCSVRYLHRLDKDTTGCVLFATNFLSHSFLSHEWESENVHKEYLVLIEGHLRERAGRIALPIGKDRHRNNHYIVYQKGKPALTNYEVIREYPGYSLLKISIETGRTHQIRVHMASIGHPVLGDLEYGALKTGSSRVMLHASSISYLHPITHEKITVDSPLPEDFRQYAY